VVIRSVIQYVPIASVQVDVASVVPGDAWCLTNVYGPTNHADKDDFLQELRGRVVPDHKPRRPGTRGA
jgi:hypothetical protein